MALVPEIALEAGKPPQGAQQTVPNLLNNPSQLNALLQIQGNMAAGKALQGAIDPSSGAFDQAAFSRNLAANPAAAMGALDAMNKGLTAGRAQLEQSIIRRQQMQKNLVGLLIDPRMRTDADYANKMVNGTLSDLAKQGLISPQTAAAEAAMKPVDADGKLDLNALDLRLKQHLFSTLSPQEQTNFKFGNPGFLDLGDSIVPFRQTPENGVSFGAPVPRGLTPEAASAPDQGPTVSGAPQTVPRANRANQLNIPNAGAPREAPASQPNPVTTPQKPTSSLGSGRYTKSPALAKFLAAGDPQRQYELYQSMSPEDQKAVRDWVKAKGGGGTQ